MKEFLKALKEMDFRMGWCLVYAVITLTAVWAVSPEQLPVILYKASLVFLAGVAGYWVDRWVAPYARPEGYLNEEWRKNRGLWSVGEADYTIVPEYRLVFCAALIRRAVIIGSAMIAVGLGM